MMWVKMQKGVVVNGQPQPTGKVVEVSDKDGRYLILSGAAKKCQPEKAPIPELSHLPPIKKANTRRKTVKEV